MSVRKETRSLILDSAWRRSDACARGIRRSADATHAIAPLRSGFSWCRLRLAGTRLLPFLQLLLLLRVSLLQLLGLLLVLLLHLLFSAVVSLLFFHLLMLFVLLLLQLLPFLLLLSLQFVLLLLVFLILFWVPGVRRRGSLRGRQLLRMHRRVASRRVVVLRARSIAVDRSSLSSRYRSAALEVPRPRRCRDRRLPMVRRCPQLRIRSRRFHMLRLRRHRPDVPFPRRRFFLRRCTRFHSSAPPVEAHPVHRRVRHTRFIYVVNYRHVYVAHRPVVKKVSVVPPPAFKPMSKVPEAVIDSPIEPDRRPPISLVKNKRAPAPAPVRRRP